MNNVYFNVDKRQNCGILSSKASDAENCKVKTDSPETQKGQELEIKAITTHKTANS